MQHRCCLRLGCSILERSIHRRRIQQSHKVSLFGYRLVGYYARKHTAEIPGRECWTIILCTRSLSEIQNHRRDFIIIHTFCFACHIKPSWRKNTGQTANQHRRLESERRGRLGVNCFSISYMNYSTPGGLVKHFRNS